MPNCANDCIMRRGAGGMRASVTQLLLACLMLFVPVQSGANEHPLALAIAQIDADVVFMRHALAPGTGDPADFDVDDCATQRNLDAEGRAQAIRIGENIRAAGIAFASVRTSPWCRCVDTAALMAVGDWSLSLGLASFYDGHVDRAETVALLRAELERLQPGVTLMVTHQVVISAITGRYTRSGAMVAYNSQTGQTMAVDAF